ncbi:MAG: thioredoxin domain-containing protein, partial [bacterium]
MNYKRLIVILILFIFLGCAHGQVGLRTDQSVNVSKTRVELFVMSQCPYSVEAEKVIIPVIDRFRDKIDFRIYFIAYEADEARERLDGEIEEEDTIGDTGEGKCRGVPHLEPGARFYSLHGMPEVEEDMRQMVMMKHYPEKFMDYLLYRAENYASNDWESAAVRAWMNIDHIQQMIRQPETEDLFGVNIRKSHEMKIESSPTLMINGKIHKGPIDQFTLSRYICKNSSRCKECKDIPACGTDKDCQSENKVGLCLNQNTRQARCQFGSPVDIQLTIIREEIKPDEGDDQVVSYSRSLFPRISIKELDYLDKQADELINKYHINVLPAYLYGDDIDKALRFIRIEDMLLKREDAYLINPKYLARAYYPDREDKPGQVDLFIESLSKEGNHIEKELMNNPSFSDLNIKVHFWARKEETKAPENEGLAVLRMSASADQSNILYLAPQQPQITFKS